MDAKLGLVLEGGAFRGLFSCGVTDVMLEEGIAVDGVVGVSAGAAFGVNYCSRQIGRALRYNQQFAHDKRYSGMRSLLTTGNLYNAEFAYHEVPLHHDVFDFQAFLCARMWIPAARCIICFAIPTSTKHWSGFALPLRCRWCRRWWKWAVIACSMAA